MSCSKMLCCFPKMSCLGNRSRSSESLRPFLPSELFIHQIKKLPHDLMYQVFTSMRPAHVFIFYHMSMEHRKILAKYKLKAVFGLLVKSRDVEIVVSSWHQKRDSFHIRTDRTGRKRTVEWNDQVLKELDQDEDWFTVFKLLYSIYSGKKIILKTLEIWSDSEHLENLDRVFVEILNKSERDINIECFEYYPDTERSLKFLSLFRVTTYVHLFYMPKECPHHIFEDASVRIDRGYDFTLEHLLIPRKKDLCISLSHLTDADFNKFLKQWLQTGNNFKLDIGTNAVTNMADLTADLVFSAFNQQGPVYKVYEYGDYCPNRRHAYVRRTQGAFEFSPTSFS